MLRTLFFTVGIMATFVAGMGILVAQDWAADTLSLQETARCLDWERTIDNLDAEIGLREDRLETARFEADELILQINTLRDTARVDPSMQADLINLKILRDEAEDLYEVNLARIEQALLSREEARDAFNLNCSGRRYDPQTVTVATDAFADE